LRPGRAKQFGLSCSPSPQYGNAAPGFPAKGVGLFLGHAGSPEHLTERGAGNARQIEHTTSHTDPARGRDDNMVAACYGSSSVFPQNFEVDGHQKHWRFGLDQMRNIFAWRKHDRTIEVTLAAAVRRRCESRVHERRSLFLGVAGDSENAGPGIQFG
jgi:hypothetical protein